MFLRKTITIKGAPQKKRAFFAFCFVLFLILLAGMFFDQVYFRSGVCLLVPLMILLLTSSGIANPRFTFGEQGVKVHGNRRISSFEFFWDELTGVHVWQDPGSGICRLTLQAKELSRDLDSYDYFSVEALQKIFRTFEKIKSEYPHIELKDDLGWSKQA